MRREWLYLSCLLLGLGLVAVTCRAQTPIENEIFIWNGTAPGSDTVTVLQEIEDRDPDGGPCGLNRTVRKVTQPSIVHYAPTNPNGSAVLICPGGGYALLAYDKEGRDIAQWYNERDITAFVLKYRLPIDGHANRRFVPLQDAQRAMRYIRSNAQTFNISPDSIGAMGGSAGGHLAASLSVFYDWDTYSPIDDADTLSAKPDFSVLMYPVISMQDTLTNAPSRSNLLGVPFSKAAIDSFSTELHVDDQTPPAFLFHSKLDGSVTYKNSEAYANALQNAGVEYSLNLYGSGGHGVGKCEAGQSAFARWPIDLDGWLAEEGWTTACNGETPSVTITMTDSTRLSTGPALSYQWYRNGVPIEGATDSLFTPTLIGDYMVAVPGQREGTGTSCLLYSEEVTVDVLTSLKNISAPPVRVFPNPVHTELIVRDLEPGVAPVRYYILNQLGVSVVQGRDTLAKQALSVDVSTLPSGLYYIVLNRDGLIRSGKFVVE